MREGGIERRRDREEGKIGREREEKGRVIESREINNKGGKYNYMRRRIPVVLLCS